ncbi:MAG: signal peptidase I [Chloroflexi bacterium]|nr:signal peptidase I [Chloroflexota bacterium]
MDQEYPGATPPNPAPHSLQRAILRGIREILETILPALLIVLVVNLFLAQATRVEGQSMEPNLHNNQRLIIEKVSYHFHPPRRGDIVVIKLPNRNSDPLIKRVVGLPGETIEIRDGHVYINGQMLEEPYLHQLTYGNVPPHVIAPGHVFVLGDNRGASNDSRSFGEVKISYIVGRAWFRYWPLDEIGFVR